MLGYVESPAFRGVSEAHRISLAHAVDLALDAESLSRAMPAGFGTRRDRVRDLREARRVTRVSGLQGTRLTTLAEASFAKAQQEAATALGRVGVTIDAKQAGDLLTDLRAAKDAGTAPDAVLVDASLADQLRELGYRFEIVTLWSGGARAATE